MEEKVLFDAISQMMDEKLSTALEPIQSDLSGAKLENSSMKEDIAEIKTDLAGVKDDLAGFKEETNVRFDALQAEIRHLSQAVTAIEVEHGNKLNVIAEGIKTLLIDNERFRGSRG